MKAAGPVIARSVAAVPCFRPHYGMSNRDVEQFEFRNWAGTVVARPRRFYQPRSEVEVQEIVRATARRGGQVRVVGAGHSWTDVAACDDTMLNLDHLAEVVEVDFANWQCTVQAGIRLYQLIDALEARGMALANIGSVTEQSIAGAIGTGTHGSGLDYGSISTQLCGFRLVTADGEVRDVTREHDPELFAAGSVSFGSLGIMTQVTLQVEPIYDLEENSFTMPFEAVLRLAEQLYGEHPRLKFWWLPHTGNVQVYTYDKTSKPRSPRSALRDRYDRFMNDRTFVAVLGLGQRFPALVGTLNALVGSSYFKSYTRIDRYDRVLSVPMPPAHLENEYGLPVAHTAEIMARTNDLIERRKLSVGFVNEVRFVQADDNWLSPAYGRDSVQFGAYTPDGRHARDFLEGVEDIAYELGARPHWGKDFSSTPDYLRAVFPRFDDFARLRAQLDPDGVFVNDFVTRVFGL